jgi:hypothetical protein
MREEWVRHLSDFLALPRHHIHRIVQKDAADFGRRLSHENPRAWETPHGQRQGADVVLMGVRRQNRLDLAIGDCFEIRQRILACIFRVHPAIEQEPVWANFNIVRIRPDLRVPCEISEFQMRLRSRPEGFLSDRLLSEQ